MACLYCGSVILPIRRLQDSDFCCPAHRREYHSRLRKGLNRLAEAEPQPTRAAEFVGSLPAADGKCSQHRVSAGMRYPAAPPHGPRAFRLRPSPMLGDSFTISPRLQPRAGAPPACGSMRAEARPLVPRRSAEARRRLYTHIGLPAPPQTGGRFGCAAPLPLVSLPDAASEKPKALQQDPAWTAFSLQPHLPRLALSSKVDREFAVQVLSHGSAALPACVRPVYAAPAPTGRLVPARLSKRAPEVPGWAGKPAASPLLGTAGTAWRMRAAAPNGSRPLPAPAAAAAAPAVAVPRLGYSMAAPAPRQQPFAALPPRAPEAVTVQREPRPVSRPRRALQLPETEIAAPRLAGRQVFFRWCVAAREFSSKKPACAGALPILGAPPAAPFTLAVPAAAPRGLTPAAAAAAAGRLPGAASLPTAPAPAPVSMELSPAPTAVQTLPLTLTLDPGGRLEAFAACAPALALPSGARPARGTPTAHEVAPPALLPLLPREMGPHREPAVAPFAGRPPVSAAPASREVAFDVAAILPAQRRAAIPSLPPCASGVKIAAADKPLRLPLALRGAPAAFNRRGEFPSVAPGPRLPAFNLRAVLEGFTSIAAQPDPEFSPAGVLAVMPDRAARRRRAHTLAKRVLAAAAGILAAVAFWSSGAPLSAGRALAGLDWVGDSLASRAAIEHSDNFRGGLEAWQGASDDWARSWSRHPEGYVRPGEFAIFRPSLAYSNYTLRMLAQIERNGLSCAVRARDPQNYYAVKLAVTKPGPRPLVSLVRYPVVGGKKGKAVEVPVRAALHGNSPYRVAVEVHGRTFAASVEGQQVDRWTEEGLSSGGVGMFSDAGERVRLYWVRVTSNDDLLGRICAMLVRRDAPRHAWEHRRYTPLPALVLFPGSPQ